MFSLHGMKWLSISYNVKWIEHITTLSWFISYNENITDNKQHQKYSYGRETVVAETYSTSMSMQKQSIKLE